MKRVLVLATAVSLLLAGCATPPPKTAKAPKTETATEQAEKTVKPTREVKLTGNKAPDSLMPVPQETLQSDPSKGWTYDSNGIVREDLKKDPNRWKDNFVSITDILGKEEAQRLIDNAIAKSRIPVGVLTLHGFKFFDTFPANMVLVRKEDDVTAEELKESLIPAFAEYLERKQVSSEMRSSMPEVAPIKDHLDAIRAIWQPKGELAALLDDIESGKNDVYAKNFKGENKGKISEAYGLRELFPVKTPDYIGSGACFEASELPADCTFSVNTLTANKPTVLVHDLDSWDGVTIFSPTLTEWKYTKDGNMKFSRSNMTLPVTLTPVTNDKGVTKWVTSYVLKKEDGKVEKGQYVVKGVSW